MPVGYKHRMWQAFLSISASGPEFSADFEAGGSVLRPRMAADLNYTTSDVDYLEEAFRSHDIDRPVKDELHRRLRNPKVNEVTSEISGIGEWLSEFKGASEWDGGALQLCFAGHGRESDGALVLADGVLTPEAFVEQLAVIGRDVSCPGRLRVSVILDSCHSGAFVTSVLDLCFNTYDEYLVPFELFASCMHDEFAWEESSLGHGLFTYCMSVSPPTLGSLAARGIQPDNRMGPSLAIASGEFGCALMTAGSQNPIGYWNGTGHIEVSGRGFNLFEKNENCPSSVDIRSYLRNLRDELRETLRPLRRNLISISYGQTDDQMRRKIHEDLAFLRKTSGPNGPWQTPNHE
jgi:hypothetical protein